jgi:hypothetical protein
VENPSGKASYILTLRRFSLRIAVFAAYLQAFHVSPRCENCLSQKFNLHKIRGLTASLITRRFFSPQQENSSQQKLRCRWEATSEIFPPPRMEQVSKEECEWQVYRTRFLIRARQLTGPLEFRDVLGREHRGERGDYLVKSSDGLLRIAPREIFEDVYVAMDVAMDSAVENRPPQTRPRFSISDVKRCTTTGTEMQA